MCIAALEREWQSLAPQTPLELQHWLNRHRHDVAAFGHHSWSSWQEVLAAIPADPDRVLWTLLAADHDQIPLAGRSVLQAMLPKAYAMARRDGYAGCHDYVVHLWLRIRSYPLRRRRQVAANLALDTLKAVKAEQRHRVEVAGGSALEHIPTARRLVETHPGDEVSARRILGAAAELGVIDPPTIAVLTSVYADGLSGQAAAERHAVSAALVRRRCSVGVRRLAAARQDLVDAVA